MKYIKNGTYEGSLFTIAECWRHQPLRYQWIGYNWTFAVIRLLAIASAFLYLNHFSLSEKKRHGNSTIY
ncbi:hypothetical protein ABG775_03205 [Peribacillus simplex]|uniref:hypothetical protein n=1 Tax=Peribacillus TaxID=2675229 RepID=UPI001786E8AB|nr:hypothetical protein [Brevibacillus sp. JNUCC-41]QOS92285.1 hypothetical protein JNUCC41_11945 [Brevibacillus sp. JNUCC-41]